VDETADDDAERALRAAVLRGDGAAWKSLYERTFPALWAYALARVGRRREAAEEVLQEVWMVAVRRIADFDPARAPFEAWVRGIAANVLRNQARSQRRAPREASLEHEPAAAEPPAESTRDERLALALTELPWAYQQVLRAKYAERLSVAEIASRTGRTTKSVESLLSRAREALRTAVRSTP
jgi:RNA polymerase sigma-70 factor (ECF subfamily)